MNEHKWKKGDEVSVMRGDRFLFMSRVEHVTPSGLPRVRGVLYSAAGNERGERFDRTRIVIPTDEHREQVQREQMWSRIRNAREEQHHLVDTATLRRMVDQLDGKAST